jgi:hypothetical protein
MQSCGWSVRSDRPPPHRGGSVGTTGGCTRARVGPAHRGRRARCSRTVRADVGVSDPAYHGGDDHREGGILRVGAVGMQPLP